MTAEETRALVDAALADPTVDRAIPLWLSLAHREPVSGEVELRAFAQLRSDAVYGAEARALIVKAIRRAALTPRHSESP